MKRTLVLTAVGLAAFAQLGCKERPEALSATTTTASMAVRSDDARMLITQRACDREVICGNIGAGKRFADRSTCLDALEHPALKADACPQGVTSPRLDACVTAIRNQQCGQVIDDLEKTRKCERKALCFGE